MEEALFCSPERRPFDHKETHHFLKKIETAEKKVMLSSPPTAR
ncbi:BnaAnng30600D [Brassica napus]|uniref:(rape) hypothetical protein n=1 Tax=Brassica napus TaxID=3708 RepID=A0A078JV74_BRANA|nr:unnamed protein product [Brassica napus]CDY69496.1 BnaAnng30600D [Brassica napus]